MKPPGMSRGRVSAVVAALWLAACGGSVDDTASSASDAVAGTPGTAPSPAAALTATSLSFAPVLGLAANQYQWVATNDTGRVMAATTFTAAGGQIFLSTDRGETFTASSAPIAAWVSLDMTPDGTRMVAVAAGGGLFRSTNGGFSWTRIDTGINPTGSLPYESVTLSDDGTRVVAATFNGPVFFSTNADSTTPSFQQATLAGGGVLTDAFRAVDGSAGGTTVIAAASSGNLYVSGDGGATFTLLPVTVGSTAVADGWYRAALSGDGTRIALAGSTDFGQGVDPAPRSTGLYVGNLAGGSWTWTQASTVTGAYTSLAMSAGGGVVGATLSSTTAGTGGAVLLSSDGGQSFATVPTPAGEVDWRAMALSEDGTRALLVAGTPQQLDGLLYVSQEGAAPAPAPAAPAPVPVAAPAPPGAPAFAPLSPALAPLAPTAPAPSPLFTPAAPALAPIGPALAPLSPGIPAFTPTMSSPAIAPAVGSVAPLVPTVGPALTPTAPAPAPTTSFDPFDPTGLFR